MAATLSMHLMPYFSYPEVLLLKSMGRCGPSCAWNDMQHGALSKKNEPAKSAMQGHAIDVSTLYL